MVQQGSPTEETKRQHAAMSWTGCYDDDCLVHLSEKDGSGWFPKKPRGQLNVLTKRYKPKPSLQWWEKPAGGSARKPTPTLQRKDAILQEDQQQESETMEDQRLYGGDREIPPSPSPESNTPDETDYGISDDEFEINDEEILTFQIEGPEPVRKIALHVAQQCEKVFPVIAGRRVIHPDELNIMLDQIRIMFWKYPRVMIRAKAEDFLTERPPLGSVFDPSGAYTAPDGIFISRDLRNKVRTLKERYRKIQEYQDQYFQKQIPEKERDELIARILHAPDVRVLVGPSWTGIVEGELRIHTTGPVVTVKDDGGVTFKPRDPFAGWTITLSSNQSGNFRDL
jgi:hypothetical protein